MEFSSIVHLGSYRSRKDSPLRRTLALYGHDAEKSLILHKLWRALTLVDGDRGGVVWVDEYGSGVPHAYALLDLASDRPRRSLPSTLFTSAVVDLATVPSFPYSEAALADLRGPFPHLGLVLLVRKLTDPVSLFRLAGPESGVSSCSRCRAWSWSLAAPWQGQGRRAPPHW